MELGIQNFTPTGNNLMWKNSWETYQKQNCQSKTMSKMENRLHYDRIFQGLTNNRSIDVLVPESLKNVKKMSTKEYITKYISENNGIKTPQQLTVAIAIALNIPVGTPDYSKVYDMVIEELKMVHDLTNSFIRAPHRIDIAIDTRSVGIEATDEGVVADANPFSFDGIPSQRVDEETGELALVYYNGDNQVPTRSYDTGGFANLFRQSGDTMTEVPGQFSLPTRLPPRISPVVFNRNALPDTTELPYEVDPSLMINNSPVTTSTQTHDGLQELLIPRPLYIRTMKELPSGVTLQEIGSKSTRTGVSQTGMSGSYPNAEIAEMMIPTPIGKTAPKDTIRSSNVAGGKPAGRPSRSPEERFYAQQGLQTRETNTLTSGEGVYQTGIGRPMGSPNVERTSSGAQIINPITNYFMKSKSDTSEKP